MKVYIGTSGWSYSWNPNGLKWYVANSGFNSVELNMSFYSFPREKQVERWFKEGKGLAWVVKVHRAITHYGKLSERVLNTWSKFRRRFSPLEESIHLYLFQLPPSLIFNERTWDKVVRFAVKGEVRDKMAIEPRHESWFSENVVSRFREEGIVFVTPDSPLFEGLPDLGIICVSGKVYVRMHGRLIWYNYRYLTEELEEVAKKIIKVNPDIAYVFFNNDHDMLDNGRELKKIINKFLIK